mgnify:FL=1
MQPRSGYQLRNYEGKFATSPQPSLQTLGHLHGFADLKALVARLCGATGAVGQLRYCL